MNDFFPGVSILLDSEWLIISVACGNFDQFNCPPLLTISRPTIDTISTLLQQGNKPRV